MRVETNERLARRNRQIAQYLFFATFGVLILGLVFLNTQVSAVADGNVLLNTLAQTAVLPLAFITTIASVRMTNLWVRQPRPEVVIREGLKGLSNKSVLYSYYHFPARHVLICPQGVFAIITKFQDGVYNVEGDALADSQERMSRVLSLFRFDGVGNPTAEAIRAADHIEKLLETIAPGVEVQPVIVFVDPKAEVIAVNPSVPVVYPLGKRSPILRDLIRDVGKENRATLTPEQIAEFDELTLKR